MVKMKETILINLRLPRRLVHDLEFISQHLNVDNKEWLKVMIEKIISQERYRILEDIEDRFIKGYISDKEYKEETGISPSEILRENRKHQEKMKEIELKGAEKYIFDIKKMIEKENMMEKNRPPTKKYLKDVIKKIEKGRKKK